VATGGVGGGPRDATESVPRKTEHPYVAAAASPQPLLWRFLPCACPRPFAGVLPERAENRRLVSPVIQGGGITIRETLRTRPQKKITDHFRCSHCKPWYQGNYISAPFGRREAVSPARTRKSALPKRSAGLRIPARQSSDRQRPAIKFTGASEPRLTNRTHHLTTSVQARTCFSVTFFTTPVHDLPNGRVDKGVTCI